MRRVGGEKEEELKVEASEGCQLLCSGGALPIRVPIPFSYCRGWSGAAVIGIAPVIRPGREGRGKLHAHSACTLYNHII